MAGTFYLELDSDWVDRVGPEIFHFCLPGPQVTLARFYMDTCPKLNVHKKNREDMMVTENKNSWSLFLDMIT
jgi:hypothetical protein